MNIKKNIIVYCKNKYCLQAAVLRSRVRRSLCVWSTLPSLRSAWTQLQESQQLCSRLLAGKLYLFTSTLIQRLNLRMVIW